MYIIENVEIRYPRIDQPYRFDRNAGDKGKSVPCGELENTAEYSLKFVMDKASAKKLYGAMLTAYQEAREDDWEDFSFPFEKDTDSDETLYIATAKIKAAYNGQATKRPVVYDSDTKEMPEEFKLTTGSVGNVAFTFYPFNYGDRYGVALRIRAVQVIKYKEPEVTTPFGVVDGFKIEPDNPFVPAKSNGTTPTVSPTIPDDLFGDDEPVKQVKKATKKKPAKSEDKDLKSIVDDWDD